MKKKILMMMMTALTAGALFGCGAETAAPEETAELKEIKTEEYVELGEYTGLQVSAPAPEVTEEEVQKYIDYMLRMKAEPVEVTDRPVEDGDTVNIDYEGKLDGVPFDRGADQGFDLTIGSHSFIDGFEEGLIGATTGETLDLNLTFPDPYTNNPDLAGKPVVFTVKVNAIKAVPQLDDELAKMLDAECATAEEYRQKILDQMIADKKAEYDNTIETALIDQIRANATFKKDPPEEMVQQYLDRIRTNLEAAAGYYNMTFDDLLMIQYDIRADQFEEEARPGAVESAQESIMLQAIANKEGLNPTEEELQKAMEEEAQARGFESADAFREAISETNYRDYNMVSKVLEFVKENSDIGETGAE
ncbi:MAG: trigger factor [Clostridiales bacterium]|nr:trigger factor [Clostridiales bacterium]